MDVCLRCDWTGRGARGTCPRCGAPLYRDEPAPLPGAVGEPAAPIPADGSATAPNPPGDKEPGLPQVSAPASPAGRLAGPAGLRRALGGLLAVGLVVALVWSRGPSAGPRRGSDREPFLLQGTLVYATDVGRREQRLWLLDLPSGRLERGPLIPRTSDLVASSGGWGTWVALLSRRPEGGLRAYVLTDLAADARPELVGVGDLAAWGPHATSLVLVRRGPLVDGCRRVVIRFLTVEPPSRATVYERPHLCGDVVSVGRDTASTYFTQIVRERVGVFIPGFERRPHPVLRGHAMLSVAFTGGMLVTPAGGVEESHGIGPFGTRAERDPQPRPVSGLLSTWNGRGRPTPIGPVGAVLSAGRVLAWSGSGGLALVAGSLHDVLGLFMVDASVDAEDRTPRFVAELRGAAGATFASDGTAIVAMGGRLYAVRGGGLHDVSIPIDAPVPTGPVVWLP